MNALRWHILLAAVVVNAAAAWAAGPAGDLPVTRKDTLAATLATAPAQWDRNADIALAIFRRLAEWFPADTADLARLAARVGDTQFNPDTVRFDVVGFALRMPDLAPADRDLLRLTQAKLQARFCSHSIALATVAGIEHPDQVIAYPATRDTKAVTLADAIEAWRDRTIDILATGRSYEAERLLGEADELAEREDYRASAARLIEVILKQPNGYLPQPDGAIVSTGAFAADQLTRLASRDIKGVVEAAESADPGLFRRADEGDRAALVRLAELFSFTPAGVDALRRLAELDLDEGRPRLAALRLRRVLAKAADHAARAEALWRLALAETLAGEREAGEAHLAELAALKATVRIGGRAMAAAEAAQLVGAQARPAAPAVAWASCPCSTGWKPVPRAGAAAPPPAVGQTLRPALDFTYHVTLFDQQNRTSQWPRFWGRPEALPTFSAGRAFLHDSKNLWAVDLAGGRLLWHYRQPGRLFERQTYWGVNDHTTLADQGSMIERTHTPPLIGPDGVYFLGKDHPGLFGFESQRGRRLFAELPRTAIEMIGLHEGRLIAAGRGEMFALDAAGGQIAWELRRAWSAGAPWRSGDLRDGRIYWPVETGLLVIDAATGRELGTVRVEAAVQPATVRFLPDGELAALGSDGGVDHFMVLSAGAASTRQVAESTPGLELDAASLVERDPAAIAAAPTAPATASPIRSTRPPWPHSAGSPRSARPPARPPPLLADRPGRLAGRACPGHRTCQRMTSQPQIPARPTSDDAKTDSELALRSNSRIL